MVAVIPKSDREIIQRELIAQSLSKIFLLSGLNKKQITQIASISKILKPKKKETIFQEGDEYKGFYCIAEGIIKIFRLTKEGKERIIHILHSNETFAEVPLLENYNKIMNNEAKYPANAMNICEGTRLIFIPAKEFIEVLRMYPEMCFGLFTVLSKKLRMMQEQIVNVKSRDVTGRLVNYLLSEYETKKAIEGCKNIKHSNTFQLSVSKIDLASYIGATLETLSRTFKKLQNEKLIKIWGKNITIIDYNGLKKLI
ncbi:MAG: Crp/Fnr family transcriptional regulator [Ignavibacteria bacterium]|nr:Crp/Fnr family transcriptional regulator [Ignavibacteria bacterium]